MNQEDASLGSDHQTSRQLVRGTPTRTVLAILGALAAFGPISTDLYLPFLPAAADDLYASAAGIQATLTASVVGLGVGQLLIGPLSDRFGRRLPVLIGLALFVIFSVGCALAPTVELLMIMRLGQALGGSAGLVVSRAIVRDSVDRHRLVDIMGLLTMVSSSAAILGPLVGGQLARFTTWRGVFVVLGCVGIILIVATALLVKETLPPDRRVAAGFTAAFHSYATVLRDTRYVLTVLCFVAAFGCLFAYIAASPFILQVVHGMSPQVFGVIYAANAIGIFAFARVRWGSVGRRIVIGLLVLTAGLGSIAVGALSGLLWPVLLGFLCICCSWGLLGPVTSALALARHPQRAGAAAAVLGAAQFLVAGFVGPLVGVAGPTSLVPMICVLAGLLVVAWAVRPGLSITDAGPDIPPQTLLKTILQSADHRPPSTPIPPSANS